MIKQCIHALKSIRFSNPLVLATCAMLLLWIFYPIRNHSEADDAYMFASNVRDLTPASLVESPAHRLYHVFTQFLWMICGKPDAVVFMTVLSVIYGLVAILMIGLIARQRLGFSMTTSIITALFFASIYNVWRYSHEVETYSMAWASSLFAMWLALGPRGKVAGGLIGGISTGFHIMGALMVGPAIALALWIRDGFRPALVYCAAVWGGLAVMFTIPFIIQKALPEKNLPSWMIEGGAIPWKETQTDDVKLVSNLQGVPLHKTAARETFALGATILASNWLFYDDSVVQRLSKLFPEKNITEETALGVRMPDFLFWISSITFVLAAVAFVLICGGILTKRHENGKWTLPNAFRVFGDWRLVLLLVWLGSYFAVQINIGAAAPESWTPVVPSLALFFGLGLSFFTAARQTLFGTIALLLVFVHNFVGGIAPLRYKEWDLNFQQNQWLIEHGTSNDVVIGCNYLSVDRYLNWYSAVKTIQFSQCAKPEHVSRLMNVAENYTRKSGGRILVRHEVLHPPAYLVVLGRPDFSAVARSWQENGLLKKVAEGDFPIYEYVAQ